MSVYQCKLGTDKGEILTRAIAAESEEELRREAESKGMFVISVRKNWARALLRPAGLLSKRIGEREFLTFNQQFAALLRSGLPVLRALDIIVEKMKPGYLKDTLSDIREKIKSGQSLSEAFGEKKGLFPGVYAASLLAGERSGNLDVVLKRYMAYQQQLLTARRRIRGALIYPSVLLTLSMCLAFYMAAFVIPEFGKIYSDSKATLPGGTLLLLSLTGFLRQHLLLVLALLVAAGGIFRSWLHTDRGRLALGRFAFRLPLLGTTWHEHTVSQFCRTLSTLIAGGIPVVSALETASGALGNLFMSRRIRQSVQMVREGETVSSALESTGLFPSMAIEMIQVGETTGSLDALLGEVATFYDDQVDTRMNTMLSLLEPIVLVVMGVIVAVMLLAIYLPLFNLSQVMH